MVIAASISVSKRLRALAFTGLCLIAAQMLIALSSCHPEYLPAAARATTGR
jgi:hypothetical protein